MAGVSCFIGVEQSGTGSRFIKAITQIQAKDCLGDIGLRGVGSWGVGKRTPHDSPHTGD